MSKESYARGFCKVAEAHGIDPVALSKFASGTDVKKDPIERAGIGTGFDNRVHETIYGDFFPGNKDSYVGRLLGNTVPKEDDYIARKGLIGAVGRLPLHVVGAAELSDVRRRQANEYAEKLHPFGSREEIDAIAKNLINAGKENWKSYLKDFKVPNRTAPNQDGLKNVWLDLEKLRKLRSMQNSMVRKSAPRQMNIA